MRVTQIHVIHLDKGDQFGYISDSWRGPDGQQEPASRVNILAQRVRLYPTGRVQIEGRQFEAWEGEWYDRGKITRPVFDTATLPDAVRATLDRLAGDVLVTAGQDGA